MDFRVLERLESSTGWDQVTKNHVFLQADKVVDFACQRSFGKYFGCFLETRGRDKAGTLNGCLGDSKQLSTVSGCFGLGAFGWFSTKRFNFCVGLFKHNFRNDLALGEIAVAFVGDFDALGKLIID